MTSLIHKIFTLFSVVFFISILFPQAVAAKYVDDSFAKDLFNARELESLNDVGMGFRTPRIIQTQAIEAVAGAVEGITRVEGKDSYNDKINQRSALGGVSKLIAMMYDNPPASTYAFVRDMGQTLGFIPKQTYAQGTGIGFTGLSPLLPIWKAFRNIAYLLLAIIMIVVGLMIMLRKNIDPKTVVTVQNALPRIIMTIILITFSYAIVGVLIDVMYIVLLLFANMIYAAAAPVAFPTPAEFVQSNFFVTVRALFGGSMSSLDDILKFLYPSMTLPPSTPGSFDFFAQIGLFAAALIPILLPSATLLVLILFIAILFMIIRIFFMLLSAYIQIIVSLLIGPLQILLDAVPGGKGFETWIKNLVSNLIVFPITALMMLIGVMFTQSNVSDVWMPPMMNTGGGQGMLGIIGLGVLATIPTVVKSMQKAMKAESIPVGMGGIVGPMGSGAMQALTIAYQLKFLKSGSEKPQPAPGTSALGRTTEAAKGVK